MDVLVRLSEQAFQGVELGVVEPIVQGAGGEAFEQDVELLHPPPAAPARPVDPHLPGHGAGRGCFTRAPSHTTRTSAGSRSDPGLLHKPARAA